MGLELETHGYRTHEYGDSIFVESAASSLGKKGVVRSGCISSGAPCGSPRRNLVDDLSPLGGRMVTNTNLAVFSCSYEVRLALAS